MAKAWIALAALWVLPLVADDAPIVTEAEFVAAVEANGRTRAALGEDRALAEAAKVGAGLWPNPNLVALREEPGEGAETTVSLAWPLPSPGRRRLGLETATLGLEAADLRLAAASRALVLELTAAYARWALAFERKEEHKTQHLRLAALMATAWARARGGEISGLVARRLSVEAAQAESELAGAEAELARAHAALVGWWPELPAAAQPALPELLPVSPKPATPLARPDLLALERERARAERALELAGKWWAAPEIELGWKRLEAPVGSSSGAVVGLGWSLPLSDRRQAERLAAEARLSAATAELELAHARAGAELDGAFAAYRLLHRRAESARAAVTELAALTQAAEAAYGAGEADLTDFLDILRAAAAARLAALNTWEEALAAARALTQALGTPLSPSTGGLP